MFTLSTYFIGSHEIVSVRNQRGTGLDFIPKKGGAIHQLYMGKHGTPILDSFVEGDDIDDNPWHKQALLFPFPNRLKDGTYVHNGINYHFPINEIDRNNALHGFLFNESLEVSEINKREKEVEIILTYSYEGQYAYYPFPCKLTVNYLVTENEFKLSFKIENTGKTSLPYGFGWHSYFLFEHQAEISMPASYQQVVDKRLLPTGKEVLYDDLLEYKTLEENLDTCFRFIDKQSRSITIGNKEGHQLEVRAGESMDYIQIFNPEPNRIAVEPITCNINAFINKKGLNILKPNEKDIHQCSIVLL